MKNCRVLHFSRNYCFDEYDFDHCNVNVVNWCTLYRCFELYAQITNRVLLILILVQFIF